MCMCMCVLVAELEVLLRDLVSEKLSNVHL